MRNFESDGDLERAERDLPQEAYEALFLLASGYDVDAVFRELEKPEPEQGVQDLVEIPSYHRR